MGTKDLFSKQADHYVKYRPHYPEDLYKFTLGQVKSFDTAWDCGTGNGQVAQRLARDFKDVIATDISKNQLDNAFRAPNIIYRQAQAENTEILGETIDLITVGQAIHWFDFDRFYAEVSRVSKPDGILCYWGYALMRVNEEINERIEYFHDNTIGEYWDQEREIWRNEYNDIQFPIKDKQKETFTFDLYWDLDHLEGYLNSWSAVQHYIALNGKNPVHHLIEDLRPIWSDNMKVTFPIFLTLGKVN